MFLRWTFLRRALLLSAAACAVLSVDSGARAEGDPDVDRIVQAGHAVKWNWTPPGKDQRYGHAEVLVNASMDAVHKVVTDYGHYRDLAPDKLRQTRIIAKEGGNTDVYTQVPILDGMYMAWYVVRFGPTRVTPNGTRLIDGQMLRGNIPAMSSTWTLRPVNDEWTLVKLDLLGLPNVPVPQAWIDEGLRDAAEQAVDAVHDKAQGNPKWIPYQATATAEPSK
jgi:hypothetical protein